MHNWLSEMAVRSSLAPQTAEIQMAFGVHQVQVRRAAWMRILDTAVFRFPESKS